MERGYERSHEFELHEGKEKVEGCITFGISPSSLNIYFIFNLYNNYTLLYSLVCMLVTFSITVVNTCPEQLKGGRVSVSSLVPSSSGDKDMETE